MFDFRTRKGKKLRATDAAQGLFFLLPYPIRGCGNLESTVIWDMHKTIAITVQQVTRTHAHPRNRYLRHNDHTNRIAMRHHQEGTEILKGTHVANFIHLE